MSALENRTTCQNERSAGLREPSGSFVAKCDENGAYNEIQCYGESCWCVDSNGIEREETRTEDEPPVCPTGIADLLLKS